jgi:hypothetical protein
MRLEAKQMADASNGSGLGRRNAGSPGHRLVAAIGIGLLAASGAGPSSADWFDDFDGGFGLAWSFAAVDDASDPPSTGTSTFAVVEAGADDHLLLSHSTTAIRDGGGGATDAFGWVDEVFGDVVVLAEMNADPSAGQQSLLALLARADPATGTTYAAGIDFADSFFAIGRRDDVFSILAVDETLTIDPNATYRVQFFLIGSNLVARLIEGSTGELLSTLSAVDGVYTSGVTGVLVETQYDLLDNPVAPIVGTFDDVEALPEASAATLLACGSLGLLGAARSRLLRRSQRSS